MPFSFATYAVSSGDRAARVVDAGTEYVVEGFVRSVDETWRKLERFPRTKPLENFLPARDRADAFVETGK